ncbi:MAG TPA: Npt1/Npt2 family nucleotide transporter, partial [Vicinamibacteria bacterium]
DVSVFILVAFVVAAYIRIGRRMTLPALVAGSLGFLTATGLLLWGLTRTRVPHGWTYSAIYVWVGVLGALAPAQVWTIANYVLAPREAKRLFGLLGSGATFGTVFGGVFSHAASRRYGAESLLLAIAVLLAASAALVLLMWRRSPAGAGAMLRGEERGAPRTLSESIALVRDSPYLRAIAGLVCVSSFVTAVAGWQFKAVAQHVFQRKDALAAFFGSFNAWVGLATLAAQLLLTSRVLAGFGLRVALFGLPVALLVGSGGMLLTGGLLAAVWMRGSDKVFRYSIDRPATELLYLPLAPHVKAQVKSFIDIVVWRLGDGLAAVPILALATFGGLGVREISVVTIVFGFAWLAIAARAERRYVAALRESIQQHRLDAERSSAPVLDRATTEVLAARLGGSDVDEILYALSLLGVGRHQAAHPAVRGLLAHPSPAVRQQAVAALNAARDQSVRPAVEKLLEDRDPAVRTEALLYLSHHADLDPLARIEELGDFADFSVRAALVSYLARSGERQNLDAARLMLAAMVRENGAEARRTRLEAARLAGTAPEIFEAELAALVRDADPEVAREAIRIAGRAPGDGLVPALLELLDHPQLGEEASESLARRGDRVLSRLEERLADARAPVESRRRVPGVLARIGSRAAAAAAVQHLLESDIPLRFAVIACLNKLRRDDPEMPLDAFTLEAVLAAEIMGHYRSYQILGGLERGGDADEALRRGLREAMDQELERIFRLMGLLFPGHDLHSVYVGLRSSDPVIYDHALDFLDHVLRPSMRSLLLPLLDNTVTVAERIARADRLVGAAVETREEAVAVLLSSEDPWLRSCAVYAIGALGLKELEPRLSAWADAADPLLRETVRQAQRRLSAS